MRAAKKNIKIDVESAMALMQETYNDIVEQKAMATLIMKKMLKFMKEDVDMPVIGPVIKDQQKLLNDCIEKKISIVKLQAILLKQLGTTGTGSGIQTGGRLELSAEERALIQGLVTESNGDIAEPQVEKYG